MRHPIFVGLLSLILAFARVSNVRAAPPVALPLEEHVLPNGLRVLLAPDPHMVDVSVVVRYAAGARDDPAGHEGLAHLVEHLMFTKSKHVPLRGHFHLLEGAGASDINGMTMEDDTIYRETVPPERLELALWLESDRMGYLLDTLDDDALQHQRTTVLNEYRETRVDTPLSAVPGITQAELFPAGHPYHHDATRLVQAIERTSLDDVRAFVSTWYGPSNAMLTIAGRFDPSQAMTLITRYFATLPPHPPAVRATPPAPGPLMQTYLHVGARVSHDQLRISWITPSYGALGDAELDLAAAVLVRGDASWLHRALIEERHLALAVSARQRSMRLASVFEIDVTLADGRERADKEDGADAIDAIDKVLARFVSGTAEGEIRRAQTDYENRELFGLELSMTRAARIASRRSTGPLVVPYDWDFGIHAAISPRGVGDAVARYLSRYRRIITLTHATYQAPTSGVLLRREGYIL